MSKISATEFIKKYNPQNISGTVKESLGMLQNLKNSKGLVSAFNALGHNQLLDTVKDILKRIKDDKKDDQDKAKEIEALAKKIQDDLFKIVTPPNV